MVPVLWLGQGHSGALTGRRGARLGARPWDLPATLLHAPAVAAVAVALQRGEVPAGVTLWHVLIPAGAAPVVLQQTLPPALAHAGGPLRGLWHGKVTVTKLLGRAMRPLSLLPWALTWAPAAWWGGARRCPCARDLLPSSVHAPAVPRAAVALQGSVLALLVTLWHVPVAHWGWPWWHLPRVHPCVLAGCQLLDGLCWQQTSPARVQGVPHCSPGAAWHPVVWGSPLGTPELFPPSWHRGWPSGHSHWSPMGQGTLNTQEPLDAAT